MVLDQVKHRYMLETPVLSSSHYLNIPLTAALLFLIGYRFTAWGLLGVMHNLVGRVNQQVTSLLNNNSLGHNYSYALSCSGNASGTQNSSQLFNTGGTSETTRDARFKKSNFDFRDYNKVKPSHIKELDPDFLSWFIGFLEGDGSFAARDANKVVGTSFRFEPVAQRGEFEITQVEANRPLLMKIRTTLGFGQVFSYTKNGREYCRFYTSSRENIIRLMVLINGNLVLEKRREQFKQWFNALKKAWNLDLVHKESSNTVSLDNAWLSGFTDADGGFHTNVKTNFRGDKKPSGGHYVRYVLKFYITQAGEVVTLKGIADLVGAANKLYKLTNGKSKTLYDRVEIAQDECIDKLIQYFTRFPLKGLRRIACLRWARVNAYRKQGLTVCAVGAEKLARLLENLQDPGEDVSVADFMNSFTPGELEVIKDLPRRAGASNPSDLPYVAPPSKHSVRHKFRSRK